jgi:DtxR family Mn-dependent transcriptional regulator
MNLDYSTTIQEYVEIIYELQKKHKVARVKEIAKVRGVTLSSVTAALNLLKEKDLVEHEHYGVIVLTKKAEKLAKQLLRRHITIKNFLVDVLGVSEQTAETDACVLEHHISSTSLNSLIDFLDFIDNCPKGEPAWLQNYKETKETGKLPESCLQCRNRA